MKRTAYGAAMLAALGAAFFTGAGIDGFAAELNAQPAAMKPPIPMFGKNFYVILTTANGDGSEAQKHLHDHFLYQADLEKRGITFGAGPMTNVDSNDRVGLIIIRADSPEAARKIADADPEHINKARSYKLYKWMLNEGQIGVRVNLSDGTIVLE